MNISSYINGFNSYLRSLNSVSGTNYTVSGSSDSVILYSDLFKDYIEEKTGINVDSISLDSLLDMQYVEGKLVNSQNIPIMEQSPLATSEIEKTGSNQTILGEEQTQTSENDEDAEILDFINSFMENESFKNAIDYDKSGSIDQQEIDSFWGNIKNNDKDGNSLSLNDLLLAFKSIQDGIFVNNPQTTPVSPSGDIADETGNTTPAADNTETNAESASGANSVASAGGGGGGGGGSYDSSDVSSTDNSANSSQSIENMTEEQLEAKLQTTNQELSTAQSELEQYQNGTQPDSTKMEEAYKAYTDAIGPEKAKELDEIKTKITEKETEITNKTNEIVAQIGTVAGAQLEYDNAKSRRELLEAKLSKIDSSNPEQAALKSGLESEITTAKRNETEAQTALTNAKIELDRLNGEKTVLEGELATLNTEFQTKEAELTNGDAEIQKLQDAYDTAKQEFDTAKAEGIKQAQSTIEAKSNEIVQIKAQKEKLKVEKELDKTYPTEPEYNEEVGKALAERAIQTAKSMDSVGSCLNGVGYSVRKFFGQKTKLSTLHYAYLSTEQLRTDPFLKQHFKEVKNLSREDLKHLPAGAIVVWDKGAPNATAAGKKAGHISIALGDGREASDHIQKQMTNRQSQYYVFYPV